MVALRRIALFTSAVAVVGAVGACKKAQPPAPVVPAFDSTAIKDSIRRAEDAARLARARQDSINRAEALKRQHDQFVNDSIAAARAAADAAERDAAAMRSTVTSVVNYDFDKADLRPDTRAALEGGTNEC